MFTYAGGTKNSHFVYYFTSMLAEMKIKYPSKKLVFVLDNLASHKCNDMLKSVQDDNV